MKARKIDPVERRFWLLGLAQAAHSIEDDFSQTL
jgi:hypothetical protein